MDIDNLSVTLKTNGADDAIRKIWDMAASVDALAKSALNIDGSRLEEFANGLRQIKSSVPSANQATNMSTFAGAITEFTNAISGANITQVATDMSNLSSAVQGMGARSVRTLTNATQAMQNFAQQTRQAAQNANINQNPGNNQPQANTAQRLLLAFQQVNTELNRVAVNADSIGGRLQRIGALVPTSRFRSLSEQLDNVRRRYDELRERMNQALLSGQTTPDSAEFQRWSRNLEGLRNDYDRLIERQRALALEGRGFQLNPNLQKGLEGFKQGFNGVINIAKGGFVNAIKSANRQLSSFVKNITGANSAQKALQKTMNSLKSMPDKIIKGLTRIGKMLRLMVTRMALRAVIKEVGNGFKSLALHSEEFDASMSSVINSSKQLGYSFSAMVSPLINALAPAIVYVINLLTQLLNAINQVFSALTGASTWNKAKAFTDSWSDSIKDAGKSGSKAAKELKKTVLAFDELNQLQENKNSGGGGGNDITDMFETMQIDPKWKEFAKWLEDMWGKKDFTELGTKLGENLKKALDSIPWDRIRQTSNDLGKALATLINGFVEVQGLAYSIGTTVSQGVNTVFEFINGFVHNLHWKSIGKFIADTFNGFFENIDWELIKDTVITGISGLADAINSFIDNFHWDNISNTITNGINIVIHAVNTFFKQIKWKQLGQNLGEQLQKTIEGIHWREVGETLGRILQSAVDFLSSFIHQIKVDDVRAKLKEMVEGFFDTVNTEELGRLLADIIDLVIQIAAGFWKDNGSRIKEEGKKLIKGIWDGVDPETKDHIAKIVGQIITAAVLAGVAKAGVALLASTTIRGFKNLILGALFGTTGTGAVGTGVTATVTAAGVTTGLAFATGVAGGVNSFITTTDVVKNVVLNLGESFGLNKKQVDELKESYEGVGGTMKLLKDGIKTGWYALTGQTDKINSTTTSVKNVDSATKDLSNSLENAKPKVVQIKDEIDNADQKFRESKNYIDDVKNATKNLDTKFVESKGIYQQVTTAVSDATGAVKEHKTHLDVIREAQAKTVTATAEAKTSFMQFKDATGQVTLVLKDNKPAYEKAGEAAKGASDQVSKYMGTTKDEIKVVAENTVVLKDNKPAYDKAGDAAKSASDKLKTYESSTKDVIRVIPQMTDEAKNVQKSMGDISTSVEETTSTMKKSFTKESWTFSGIQEGLVASFQLAFAAVKGKFRSFIDDINDKLHVEVKGEKMDIGRVGYATGGFPEDGLFFANHTELVGTFSNGKTAVANNAQIVEGIQSGVYNAVMSAMSQQNTGASYISNTIMLDGDVVGRSITKAQEKTNRRYSPQTV